MQNNGGYLILTKGPFRYLLLAQVVSGLGDACTLVALPFAVLGITHSPAALGLVLGARTVPQIVSMLAGGVIADRIHPGRILAVTNWLRAAGQAALALLLLTGRATVPEIALLYGLHGVFSAFYYPASRAMVPHTVDRRQLQRAGGLSAMAASTTAMLGPLVVGGLLLVVRPGGAIACDAASFALAALAVGPLSHIAVTAAQAARTVREDIRAGLREVVSRRWLSASLGYASAFQFTVLGSLAVLGPVVVQAGYAGPKSWGVLLAADGVGSLLAGVLALRLTIDRPLLIGYLVVLPGISGALVALAVRAPFTVLVVAFAGYGLSLTFFDTLWHVALQSMIPGDSLAKVSAFDGAISSTLRPVSLAVIGPAAGLLGIQPTLLACAALTALGTVAIVGSPAIRRMRLRPHPDSAPGKPESRDLAIGARGRAEQPSAVDS